MRRQIAGGRLALALMVVVLGVAAALLLGADGGSRAGWAAVPIVEANSVSAVVLVSPLGTVYSLTAAQGEAEREGRRRLPFSLALRNLETIRFQRLYRLQP